MNQHHLRDVLACLGLPALGQPKAFFQARDDLFDKEGRIGASNQTFLQAWMDPYLAWVKKHAG